MVVPNRNREIWGNPQPLGKGREGEGRRGEGKRGAPQARMRAEVRWGKEKKGGEEGGKRERKREGKGGEKKRASAEPRPKGAIRIMGEYC